MEFFIDTEGVDLRRQVRRTKGKADVVCAAAVGASNKPATPQLPPPGSLDADPAGVEPPITRTPPLRDQPRGRQCLYFDLETIPDYSRSHLFDLDPIAELPPVVPFDDLLDPPQLLSQGLDEIRKYLSGRNADPDWLNEVVDEEELSKKPRKGLFDAVAEVRQMANSVAAAKAEQRKKMSVTPEFCRIVAFGWAVGGGEVNSVVIDGEDYDECERRILRGFWSLAHNNGPLVGYNITGFDLNVIRARSILLGIQPTRNFADIKPWDQSAVIDLMLCRFPKGGAMKLKQLARLYGIDPPAGDCEGSQVEGLARTDPEKLGEYVRSDVWVSRELHRKWMGYFTVS